MPRPPSRRKASSIGQFKAKAQAQRRQQIEHGGYPQGLALPSLCPTGPATSAPITVPTRAIETVNPWALSFSRYRSLRALMAPEMTAVSNPKRSPPNAPLTVALAKLKLSRIGIPVVFNFQLIVQTETSTANRMTALPLPCSPHATEVRAMPLPAADQEPISAPLQRAPELPTEPAAVFARRAPGQRHFGIQIDAIAGFKHFGHAACIQLQLAFQHINQAAHLLAVFRRRQGSARRETPPSALSGEATPRPSSAECILPRRARDRRSADGPCA